MIAALDVGVGSCDSEWTVGGIHSSARQCFHTSRLLQPLNLPLNSSSATASFGNFFLVHNVIIVEDN